MSGHRATPTNRSESSRSFGRWRMTLLVGIFAFGLTALAGAVGLTSLSSVFFITGFFILIPLIWVLGDSFPLVDTTAGPEAKGRTERSDTNPVRELRERYVRGEIDDAEFDRRLDRLLETEDVERLYDRNTSEDRTTRARSRFEKFEQ